MSRDNHLAPELLVGAGDRVAVQVTEAELEGLAGIANGGVLVGIGWLGEPLGPGSGGREKPRLSAGDVVAAGLVLFLALVPGVAYVPLRHGLLAPMTLFVIADITRERGLLSRLLSWHWFGRLSEVSFSLFALQMPAGV